MAVRIPIELIFSERDVRVILDHHIDLSAVITDAVKKEIGKCVEIENLFSELTK